MYICSHMRLASRLVRNGDWLDFIADGGYRTPTLWMSDGWACAQANGWIGTASLARDTTAAGGRWDWAGWRRSILMRRCGMSAGMRPMRSPAGPARGCRPRPSGRPQPATTIIARTCIACLAMDMQRLQPISGLSAGRRRGRRIQRQVHDQPDGAAGWFAGNAAQVTPGAATETSSIPTSAGSSRAFVWRTTSDKEIRTMPDDSALRPAAGSVADAALTGLLQARKTLPAKLFYDEEGCRLFSRITELPEYYLTRTERALAGRRRAARRGGRDADRRCWSNTAPATRQRPRYLLRRPTSSRPMCRSMSRRRSLSRCARGCADAGRICWSASLPADFMDVAALADGSCRTAASGVLSRIDDRQSGPARGAALPAARAHGAWA